jgi:hypothetical protein
MRRTMPFRQRSPAAGYRGIMRAVLFVICLIILAIAGLPALAADAPQRGLCLSKAEQRAAVQDRKAVPLAMAVRALRAHGHRAEVLRARLCRRGESLVYLLTLLGRSGKVVLVTVDAANGELINGR